MSKVINCLILILTLPFYLEMLCFISQAFLLLQMTLLNLPLLFLYLFSLQLLHLSLLLFLSPFPLLPYPFLMTPLFKFIKILMKKFMSFLMQLMFLMHLLNLLFLEGLPDLLNHPLTLMLITVIKSNQQPFQAPPIMFQVLPIPFIPICLTLTCLLLSNHFAVPFLPSLNPPFITKLLVTPSGRQPWMLRFQL